jgi:hypothetical protein
MGVEERWLRLEERTEAQRQGFVGVISAVNGLSAAIHALSSKILPTPAVAHAHAHSSSTHVSTTRVRAAAAATRAVLFASASYVRSRGTHFGGPLQPGLGGKFLGGGGDSTRGVARSSVGEEKSHVHPLKPYQGMDRSSHWRCS